MSKSDPGTAKKERNTTIRWVVTIFFVTILISGTISFTSDLIMANSTMLVAFIILLAIVFIGIIFYILLPKFLSKGISTINRLNLLKHRVKSLLDRRGKLQNQVCP